MTGSGMRYGQLESSVGPMHRGTKAVAEGLAELHERQGEPTAAEEWRSRSR